MQYSNIGQWHTAVFANSAPTRICPGICFAVTGDAAVTECTSIGPSGSYPLAMASYGPALCQSSAISARWNDDMPSGNTDGHRGDTAVNTNFYANNAPTLKVKCAGW